jgi:hypothetical protein
LAALRDLAGRKGKIVVAVTHDLALAARMDGASVGAIAGTRGKRRVGRRPPHWNLSAARYSMHHA